MRHRLKKCLCVCLAGLTIALTGCWNNRPITQLCIVAGMGFDKAADGKLLLTAQIVIPWLLGQNASGSGGGAGESTGNAGVEVSVEGETVFDAGRNLLQKINRKAYFGHVQMLVFGEEMAKEGLQTVWDFLERDNEFSRTMRVIVVRGGTAASLLDTEPDLGKITSNELENTVDNGYQLGKSVKIQSFEVTQLLDNPNSAIVTGTADVGSATMLSNVTVSGSAIFNRQDKLVGYFTPEQTRGYLFAQDQIKSTILVIKNPSEPDRKLSLEVIRSSGQLQASVSGGRPVLTVNVHTTGNLGSEEGTVNLYTAKYIPMIESEAAQLIESEISSAWDTSRQLSCDVFSLNSLLYREAYTSYRKMSNQWGTVYPTADCRIHVSFKLQRPGLINRPAYKQ